MSRPRAMRWLVASVVSIAVGVVGTACTYGPPELQISIRNHVARQSDPQFAFAVQFSWVRRPTGLSTFPDGGRWRTLNEAGAIYLCDTLSLEVARLWAVERPAEIGSGFEPWMGPWTDAGISFSVRGYREEGPDPRTFVRFDWVIDSAGGATVAAGEPPRGPATSEPRACADRVLAFAQRDQLSVVGRPAT